jgi:hypothetical protein
MMGLVGHQGAGIAGHQDADEDMSDTDSEADDGGDEMAEAVAE